MCFEIKRFLVIMLHIKLCLYHIIYKKKKAAGAKDFHFPYAYTFTKFIEAFIEEWELQN